VLEGLLVDLEEASCVGQLFVGVEGGRGAHGRGHVKQVVVLYNLFICIQVFKYSFIAVRSHFYQIMPEIDVDVPAAHDLPECVGVLLDPEDDGQSAVVLDVGRSAAQP